MIASLFAASVLLAPSLPWPVAEEETAVIEIPSTKIWDGAPHCAFTDLVRFRDRFWCTFREATGHMPGEGPSDGVVRVISSVDGATWESVALIEEKGVDLRDPKLSVTPDGRLMVVMGAPIYDGKRLVRRDSRASFSNEVATEFGPAELLAVDPAIAGNHDWLWRVTWHEGTAYGVIYQPVAEGECGFQLVKSRDGRAWDLVSSLALDGKPNEATARFLPDGRMVIVARRGGGDFTGVIGVASAPFTEWTWNSLGVQLGGPDLVVLPDGTLITGTRRYVAKGIYTTILARIELDGTFTHLVDFPSAGDTSYPGLVLYDEELWISYYSSHEERTAIYLARVPLAKLLVESGGDGR